MLVTTQQLLEMALGYAALGYQVFPCAPGSKKPCTKNGLLDAVVDIKQIETWWQQRPNANVAIVTTGLLVLDIDAGANGWPGSDANKHSGLSGTPSSLTANGGRQYIYRQPNGKAWRSTIGRLAPKVDTRADGGYIVVPPSVLAGGKLYRWAKGLELHDPLENLPEPPAWLTDEIDRLAIDGDLSPQPATRHALANRIPKGQRNATLAKLAGAMRRVGMSQSEILVALQQVNTERCKPPIAASEVVQVATSIARYECQWQPGSVPLWQ